MRTRKLAVAAVWMAAVAWPASSQSRLAADLRVPVYMDYQGGDLRAANLSMAIASRMFRRIGVTLIWVTSRSLPPEGIRIALTSNTPASLHPDALADATPYEGTQIRVFRDRIASYKAALAPHLLAHVMVHEIIHILQGGTWHSDRGVMKASWDGADFSQMLSADLSIAQEDADSIHLGIEKRARLAAAHTNQDSLAHNMAAGLVAPLQPR